MLSILGKFRLSFTIRALLVLCGLVALPVSVIVNRAAKQRTAVAWIQELGGRVYFDHELDGDDLQMSPAQAAAPEWLLKIADDEFFRTVVTVDLTAWWVQFKRRGRADGSHTVDDTELKELLRKMPKLKYLRLGGQKEITNDSIGAILRLTELKSLEISGTSIDKDALGKLLEMPKLERLVTSLDTTGLKTATNCKVIRVIDE